MAPVNLLISADDASYAAAATLTSPSNALLIPASNATPANNATFYAPTEGQNFGKNGQSVSVGAAQTFQNVTTQIADDTNGYYIDYTLYLKLESGNDSNVAVQSVTITGTGIEKAARVAVIQGGNLLGVFDTQGETVEAIKAIDGSSKKVTEVGEVAASTTADPAKTFTVGTAAATVVTVRVWVEGQDINCVNLNAATGFQVTLGFYIP
ncbi:MAG: hypothetical protein IJW22_03475 [Clostridia bacterium]|nr:hypothetical protein [Clostridia bacterium]